MTTIAAEETWLLDVNVLVALIDQDHEFHRSTKQWLSSKGSANWSVSPFTEAGFVRVVTNPKYSHSFAMSEALEVLDAISTQPGYRFCPVADSLMVLAHPFRERLFGHRQVTDACLLGLAIRQKSVLVTRDKSIRIMAGPRYAHHVHLLE